MKIRNENKSLIFLLSLILLTFLGLFCMQQHANANENRRILENLEWLNEDEHPIVLELYTSVNCPGCSLADHILYDVSQKENVIALGCHIDYLGKFNGEQDLGIEACTNRQWFYDSARWTGKAELKTPQFIANGDIKFSGLNHYDALNKIRTSYKHTRKPQKIEIVRNKPTELGIFIPENTYRNFEDGSHGIWLVRYSGSEIKKIPPSELTPKTRIMRYANVVTNFYHIGRWYGEERVIKLDLNDLSHTPSSKPGGWVVLIQKRNGDPILAAGKIKDKR